VVVVMMVLVVVLMMIMYVLGVARLDENCFQLYILCEEVYIDLSGGEFVMHHEQLFVNSWCNTIIVTMIHCYYYASPNDYVLYISP
jgi:hypothetical protein